jgi:hypothetical protein
MTIYTQTARFDGSARALTEDEIFKLAPSVFATEAHHSRSERFAPVPTIDMIRGLNNEGFSVVGVQQAVARQEDRKLFTKHMLRLRRLDDTQYKVGDSVFEILLKNGNDGSSAYDLMGGMFRVCCLNSLVACTSSYGEVKVRHSGKAVEKVIEGTYEVLKTAGQIMDRAQSWRGIELSEHERHAFAKGAAVERWGQDEHNNLLAPVRPERLLEARRQEDTGRDLWSTFNVVQENVMQGGLRGRTQTNRRMTTRQVKGIDQSVSVNKGLWAMAEFLAERHA